SRPSVSAATTKTTSAKILSERTRISVIKTGMRKIRLNVRSEAKVISQAPSLCSLQKKPYGKAKPSLHHFADQIVIVALEHAHGYDFTRSHWLVGDIGDTVDVGRLPLSPGDEDEIALLRGAVDDHGENLADQRAVDL